jgi:hypothetical protein
MTQGGAVEAGIFWPAGGVQPVFTGGRPDSDTAGIRGVMAWSMSLTVSGTRPATWCGAPGGFGEAGVAG